MCIDNSDWHLCFKLEIGPDVKEMSASPAVQPHQLRYHLCILLNIIIILYILFCLCKVSFFIKTCVVVVVVVVAVILVGFLVF